MMRTQMFLNVPFEGKTEASTNTYHKQGCAAMESNPWIKTAYVAPPTWADPEPRRS